MDEYIKQMQDYLNKNKIQTKNEENEENDILKEMENHLDSKEEINDDEDEDFQQIINNNKNNIETNQNEKTEKTENKNMENKNIDDIPLPVNNKLNFNELLEKELSKEQNEGIYNNNLNNKKVEPKFKYVPKKKVDIVSAPTNTKKYKYYSDNFKQKKRGNSNNKIKEQENDENNYIEKKEIKEINNKKEKKERVAPIMPDNFKNSIFNRGKGYIGPKKELMHEENNNKINNYSDEKGEDNLDNINDNE